MTTVRRAILWLCLLACPAARVAGRDAVDPWSRCACPAADPSYDDAARPPSARVAYLISVHNRRTLEDGAHLLKALLETAYPGDAAVVLIHIDRRVGIAAREGAAKKRGEKDQFLYHDSSLRRYVAACHAAPACARNSSQVHPDARTNATILEVHSHFSPEWSKWSMNDPTLWAMEYLVYHPLLRRRHGSPAWDVFINLSGDSLPIVTAARIAQLFAPAHGPLGGTNFVTAASCATGLVPTSIFGFPRHSMKRSHYFQRNIPKTLSYVDALTGEWRRDVATPIYFGSQWMALCHDFVAYVVGSLAHPNGLGNVLRETLIETKVLMTDETFFATLLMNSPAFKETLPRLNDDGALASYPTMYSLRYERMDENGPNAWGDYTSADPLYDIPAKFGAATDGEGPAKPWGPYFLGVYDLGAIKDSGALFARKVSGSIDSNLVHMLPVKVAVGGEAGGLEWDALPDIRWPELSVNIKDPFVWKAKKKEKEADSSSA